MKLFFKKTTRIFERSYFKIRLFTPGAFLFSFFIYGIIGLSINASAGLGLLGAKTISTTNVIVNEFTTLSSNASAGATTITVANAYLNSNSRFPANMSNAGDLIMIIQMRGATINTTSATDSSWGAITAYNNAGKYEFVEVSGVPNGTTINLSSALTNSYTSSGQVQVIRVPRYTTLTVNSGASITTQAWNGSSGGVIAIEVSGATIINGTIDASALGFTGGQLSNTSQVEDGANSSIYTTTNNTLGAQKGEGIAGDSTTYDGLGGRYGRGAPANGGGGGDSHNCGGGGGSNGNNGYNYNGFGNPDTTTSSTYITAWDIDGATATFHKNTSSGGGRGGYSYSRDANNPLTTAPDNSAWSGDDRYNLGGLGGRPLNNSGNRIFLGGGGGAGSEDNGAGSAGGSGGGIVYLLAGGAVSGSGTINANGDSAVSATSNSHGSSSDAAGGGGGGGTVVVFATNGNSLTGLTVNATGGMGGNQNWVSGSSEAEGPGGGGGGGYISLSTPNSFTTSSNGGWNGTTFKSSMSKFPPNGATKGTLGGTGVPTNPYTGVVPLPITLLNFSGVGKNNVDYLSWTTASEINNDYFTLQRSSDGINYSFLAKVAGAGNSNIERTYQYSDDSPLSAFNYYLLSQTDFDGKTVTFDPIVINNKVQSGSAYITSAGPVPFDDNIKINYYIPNGAQTEINIINITGQSVRNENLVSAEGINSFTLNNLSSLAKGIYLLRITGGDANLSLKIIKD